MAAVLTSMRALFAPAPAFVIDHETPADVVAREALLDRAMGTDRRKKSSEKIRSGRIPAEGLALVARDAAGHVIGTVRLWNVEAGISREGRAIDALLLGPLAVDEAHAGKGIGGALMRAALRWRCSTFLGRWNAIARSTWMRRCWCGYRSRWAVPGIR